MHQKGIPPCYGPLVLASGVIVLGVLGFTLGLLPLADCRFCAGKGRFIWEEAKDVMLFSASESRCFGRFETRIRQPALSSGCGICSMSGRTTLFERWRVGQRKQVVQELMEVQEEGPTIGYCPGTDESWVIAPATSYSSGK